MTPEIVGRLDLPKARRILGYERIESVPVPGEPNVQLGDLRLAVEWADGTVGSVYLRGVADPPLNEGTAVPCLNAVTP